MQKIDLVFIECLMQLIRQDYCKNFYSSVSVNQVFIDNHVDREMNLMAKWLYKKYKEEQNE